MTTAADLAVVTMVHPGTRDDWLRECITSVRERLPAGAAHHVVLNEGPFQWERWRAYTQAARIVAIVDHDDRLVGDSLRWCLQALAENPQAGIAFTDEAQIDADGHRLPGVPRPGRIVRPYDVAMHPRPLHHLAMLRSEVLPAHLYDIAVAHGIGIDWIVRAWAALRHGAVHVRRIGYEWRRHPAQASEQWAQHYETAIPSIRRVLIDWMTHENQHPFIPWDGPAGDPSSTAGHGGADSDELPPGVGRSGSLGPAEADESTGG